MNIHSCKYPVNHTVNITASELNEPFTYFIEDGERNYSGSVIPTNTGKFDIDISGIAREFLDTHYEDIINNSSGLVEDGADIKTLYVTDDITGADFEYMVKYDYNIDYISFLGKDGIINRPIGRELDPRQSLFICIYSVEFDQCSADIIVNGQLRKRIRFGKSIHSTLTYKLNLSELNLNAGDELEVFYQMDGGGLSHNYTVVAPCRSSYVIHYVNSQGGLDSLLVSGKAVTGFDNTSVVADIGNNGYQPQHFNNKVIQNSVRKRYELNTGILDDSGASMVYELFGSPKIWIEDLHTHSFNSSTLHNNTINVKNYRNDKIVSYKFNISESIKHIRK